MTLIRSLAVVLSLAASPALARTDLAGCTYTDLVIQATRQAAYASRLYYVPGTGEVCDFLDCGGGRAPPKSTVPGCPDYTGTGTYQPLYINPKTLGNGVVAVGHSVAMATAPVAAASDVVSAMTTTASATTSSSASVTVLTGSASSAASSEASVTILTGSNTSTPSKGGSSSAQATTSASSTGAASASKTAESSSGAAKTTGPSSAAGAMQTVGAVLGPCVAAAIAAGFA